MEVKMGIIVSKDTGEISWAQAIRIPASFWTCTIVLDNHQAQCMTQAVDQYTVANLASRRASIAIVKAD